MVKETHKKSSKGWWTAFRDRNIAYLSYFARIHPDGLLALEDQQQRLLHSILLFKSADPLHHLYISKKIIDWLANSILSRVAAVKKGMSIMEVMMKSLFAHAAFFGLALFTASSAVAGNEQLPKPFTVTLDANPSETYVSATASMNYAARTLQVSLQPRMPACPEGRACIQAFPPAQTFIFRNVRTSFDDCGVAQATAVSGKTLVTLTNRSTSICESNPEVVAELTIKSNKSVGSRPSWAVHSFASARDLTASLSTVSSQQFSSGTVTFNRVRGDVELTLYPFPPECPEGMMCIQKMPDPVVLSMTDAQTEINECGIVSTVAVIDNRPSDGSLQKVIVHDNRNNRCPTFLPLATLDVIYETSAFSRIDQDLVILSTDIFSSAEIN